MANLPVPPKGAILHDGESNPITSTTVGGDQALDVNVVQTVGGGGGGGTEYPEGDTTDPATGTVILGRADGGELRIPTMRDLAPIYAQDVYIQGDDSGDKGVIVNGLGIDGEHVHATVTLTTATSTALIPGPGLLSRRSWMIQNTSDTTVWIDLSTAGAATANSGIELEPGDVLSEDGVDYIVQEPIYGIQTSGASKDVLVTYVEVP